MTTDTKTKVVTVSELQTFIEAVEFLSETENWTPTLRQWTRIREMIANLHTASPVAATQPVAYAQARPMQYGSHPQDAVMALPSAPPGPGWNAAPQHSNNPLLGVPDVNNINNPVRTPNIDTSNGQSYSSSFV